jgi:hypothetical protein
MNMFKGEQQYAIVLDAEGEETGHIVPWPALEAIRLAYQVDGYALQINGDDEPLCDFRRLPGRVWTSRHGQEIRVFQTDPGVWQCAVAGMDISDGEFDTTEAAARQSAEAVDKHTPGPWSEDPGDYPRWADLFAGVDMEGSLTDERG